GALLRNRRMKTEELLQRYLAGERSFSQVNLSEANLSQANLRNINLSEASLIVANLSGANLSGANLSGARLNVAKLNGTNLRGANLSKADLNVANLTLADLRGAILTEAALVRAEMMRSDLSNADLSDTNLGNAILREAKLIGTNFRGANLGEADLSLSNLVSANLERATLRLANLQQADLSGANLCKAELKQVNLCGAKLVDADLRGANLRWADLTGADLTGANLNGAKLSGANLSGAQLGGANLLDTSLVYADLTGANLIRADWMGADLSGATLTGAKLHGVSRFGLKSEGIRCDWVDLSPEGDDSQIHGLKFEEVGRFFNTTPPTVRITIERALDPAAHMSIAMAYYQIARCYPDLRTSPSIETRDRRTIFTFRLENDLKLFAVAWMAILPFQDAKIAQQNLLNLVRSLQIQSSANLQTSRFKHIRRIEKYLNIAIQVEHKIQKNKILPSILRRNDKFFKSPIFVTLINSNNQVLEVDRREETKNDLQGSEELSSRETWIKPQILSTSTSVSDEILSFVSLCS
ncbi:MAG: pentapeptide repeat-containing protein, partial [Geitlerinemataceae cyanobacterium]